MLLNTLKMLCYQWTRFFNSCLLFSLIDCIEAMQNGIVISTEMKITFALQLMTTNRKLQKFWCRKSNSDNNQFSFIQTNRIKSK